MTKLSLYLATLLLGSNFSTTTVPKGAPSAVLTVQMTSQEQQFVDYANAERWDRDLKTLAPNPMLVQVAREHSREMADMDYFDHLSPTPGYHTPMDRYLKSYGETPTYACLGENLFYCDRVEVRLGHRMLMESTRHRENLLNPEFDEVGVGIYIDAHGRFFVTQLFLSQVD